MYVCVCIYLVTPLGVSMARLACPPRRAEGCSSSILAYIHIYIHIHIHIHTHTHTYIVTPLAA